MFDSHVLRDPSSGPGGLSALLHRWLSFYELRTFPGGCFFIVAALEFASRPAPYATRSSNASTRRSLRSRQRFATPLRAAKSIGRTTQPRPRFELHAILMNAHALFQLKNDPAISTKSAQRPTTFSESSSYGLHQSAPVVDGKARDPPRRQPDQAERRGRGSSDGAANEVPGCMSQRARPAEDRVSTRRAETAAFR